MDKIKTSELIVKMALASEDACRCEDGNYENFLENFHKPDDAPMLVGEMRVFAAAVSNYSRFVSIRTICKVLQEYDIIENDIDVFNNDAFRNVLEEFLKLNEKKLS